MIALGIDPGAHGGAALLMGGSVSALRAVAVVAWCRMPGGGPYRIRHYARALCEWEVQDEALALPAAVHALDLPADLDCAAIEGLFAVSGQTNGIVELCESAGILRAYVRSAFPKVPIHRPLASAWRGHQLGLSPSTPAKEAERIAVLRTEQTGLVPKAWGTGYTKREWGAICEAAWIAREGVILSKAG